MKQKVNVLPDIQNQSDTRGIAIDKVGVKDIRLPIVVKDRLKKIQRTVANFSLYVSLPHSFKGTHMSRFVEILNMDELEITLDSLKNILFEMTEKLEAKDAYLQLTFPYFIKKSAPVSNIESIMDYNVSFIGELIDKKYSVFIRVVVPITSVCPCSKEISKYGAHNQRSYVTVTVEIKSFIWIEELIEMIEKGGSCQVYGVLKRPDEKYVTERGYENPKFVEDIVRDIALQLNNDERIISYNIEAENYESIHNHSALAIIKHDKRTIGTE